MLEYSIRYNVYPADNAPQEFSTVERTAHHLDEQGLKKILETKHGARVSLISWKESQVVTQGQ